MWVVKSVNLPALQQIRRFRIVAEDASRSPAGWIGFSEPFVITGHGKGEIFKQVLLVILTTLTAFVLLLGPGLILRYYLRRSHRHTESPVWLPVPGLLLLACLGLLIWKGPHLLSPSATARFSLWPLALFLFAFSLRTPLWKLTNAMERRVLLAVLLLAGIAVGKSIYSVGPPGELYGGFISRTLEVGDRSDSRIPFHVVQIVAARQKAFSSLAARLLGPWNFSHRGPVAGLAASPLVLAGPVHVPEELPEQPWTVFDPEGFSAYRIAMIVMASCMLITVFGLARVFVPEPWAFVVFLTTVTAPFIIHEIYFTWPKIVAACFVLLAVYLMIRSRPLIAGFALGLGYLSHPSALAWTPALLIVSALTIPPTPQSRAAKFKTWVWRSGALLAGLAVWLLLWRVVNKGHYEQNGFLAYFTSTDGLPPNVSNWILSRWKSTINTLVPLHLYFFDRAQPNVNQIGGTSPALVQFFFQDWNTLPFGVGIGFYFYLLLLFYRVWPKTKSWLLWVFALSLLFFIAYMGVTVTGVLREGLHAWVLGLLCFALVVSRSELSQSVFLLQFLKAVLVLRAMEVVAMLLLPAIGTQHTIFRGQFITSDIFALLLMIGGTIWIYRRLYIEISIASPQLKN